MKPLSAERVALVFCALAASACGDARHRLGDSAESIEYIQDEHFRVGLCDWGADLELIDNMEDGDRSVNERGRAGFWFAFNDETPDAFQDPDPRGAFPLAALEPPREHSRRAVRTEGRDFVEWGGGVGLDLNQKLRYDGSAYAGIAFFARTVEQHEPVVVRVNVSDRNTALDGGVCNPRVQDSCFAHHGFDVLLSKEWEGFVIEWSQMDQKLSSVDVPPADLVLEELYEVQFQTEGSMSFEFWVDDVAFLCPVAARGGVR